MWFEYLIIVLIGLTQIYSCNSTIKRDDGILKHNGRAAEEQFILHRHVDDFTDANVLTLSEQTLQGSLNNKIITTQQHIQQLYGHSNNQYYQQQPQTFQRIHISSAQKSGGNQQAHNSRQLQINEHYNNNNNAYHNNKGNGNNMQNKNRMLQEFIGQVGNMQKHNANYKHHNPYQPTEYNTGNTHNGAIWDTTTSFTRPAVRMDAIHTPTSKSVTSAYITQPTNQPLGPQNINSNNLLTEIIAHAVPNTIKTPQSTEYNRAQFRRNIPNNPFLNKDMSQNAFKHNPFLANRQTNPNSQQNTQQYFNNQSSQNIMVPKITKQNPYTVNPFLQNTKMLYLSNQPQPTRLPATDPIPSQIETTSNPFAQNIPAFNGTVSDIISTTPPSITYPTSKVTTVSAELSRLIRKEAVIFPDSIYLTRTTPTLEHILDIRR